MEATGSVSRGQWTRSGTFTSDVRLKRESTAEFYFANQRAGATAVGLAGLAVLGLLARSPKRTPGIRLRPGSAVSAARAARALVA